MLLAFVITFLLSLAANWTVGHLAHRYGWVSGPRSARHIHLRPVPRLGGIGVYFSFVSVALGTRLFIPSVAPHASFLKLLIPASFMFAVGLWDDLRPLRAVVKLIVQIPCGVALFFYIQQTPVGQAVLSRHFGWYALLLGTVFWVVLVSNSINLIDGVDGLAAGAAVLSLAAVACISWRAGQIHIASAALILIASLLGFLRFNMNPATIFLGDGGSLFLGFMVSALGLSWSKSQAVETVVAVAVAILALPLTETGVSVVRRFLSARPLFTADREHLHHKLLDRGFSHRTVTLLLYAATAICGTAGIAMAIGSRPIFAISFGVIVLVLSAGVAMLGYSEFLEIGRIVVRITEQRRIVANDVLLRKVAREIESSSCLGQFGKQLQLSFRQLEFDGFELLLAPWFLDAVPCPARASVAKWGCTVQSRALDPECWTMGIDLVSEKFGKIGWVRLARTMRRGTLLFDPNLFVTTLQPAIAASLERCLACSCERFTSSDSKLAIIGDDVSLRFPTVPSMTMKSEPYTN